jgi:hypothetical protein
MHDKRHGLTQWQYATVSETFDHIKTGVHCRYKTTGINNVVIRQKRVNFYIEKEREMIFWRIAFPIVLIC